MSEVTDQFAYLWAIQSMVKKALATGGKDNLRDMVNEEFAAMCEADGKLGHDILVNGQKVGRYTFKRMKGKPAHNELKVSAYDYNRILSSGNADFTAWLKEYMEQHIGELAEQYVKETGDVSLEGVHVESVEVPEEPDTISAYGTPSGIKPEVVVEAFGIGLPEANKVLAGMLEGSTDD